MIVFILGIIVGILLCIVARMSNSISIKKTQELFTNKKAEIVETKNPLDIDLN